MTEFTASRKVLVQTCIYLVSIFLHQVFSSLYAWTPGRRYTSHKPLKLRGPGFAHIWFYFCFSAHSYTAYKSVPTTSSKVFEDCCPGYTGIECDIRKLLPAGPSINSSRTNYHVMWCSGFEQFSAYFGCATITTKSGQLLFQLISVDFVAVY